MNFRSLDIPITIREPDESRSLALVSWYMTSLLDFGMFLARWSISSMTTMVCIEPRSTAFSRRPNTSLIDRPLDGSLDGESPTSRATATMRLERVVSIFELVYATQSRNLSLTRASTLASTLRTVSVLPVPGLPYIMRLDGRDCLRTGSSAWATASCSASRCSIVSGM